MVITITTSLLLRVDNISQLHMAKSSVNDYLATRVYNCKIMCVHWIFTILKYGFGGTQNDIGSLEGF
jgi:hypothetical protein